MLDEPLSALDIPTRQRLLAGLVTLQATLDLPVILVVAVLAFFLVLLAVQWPFASFLLSPAARNPVFGGDAVWSYGAKIGEWTTQFWERDHNTLTFSAAGIAILFASIQCRLALWFGNWLATVKR